MFRPVASEPAAVGRQPPTAGSGDATIRVEQLTRAFGEQEFSAYLSQFKDRAWYDLCPNVNQHKQNRN